MNPTINFTEKRNAVLSKLEKTSEKIKNLSFKEMLAGYRKLFASLVKEAQIDADFLDTKGSDESSEGHSALVYGFQYACEDMGKVIIKDWNDSKNTEEFFQNFMKLNNVWNILGEKSRKRISCTVDVMHRIFNGFFISENSKGKSQFLSELNLDQLFELRKVVLDSDKGYYWDLFQRYIKAKLDLKNLEQAFEFILSSKEKISEKEMMYGYVAQRDDFNKLTVDKMKHLVDESRSEILAKKLLSRNDLPVDLFLLKVATGK